MVLEALPSRFFLASNSLASASKVLALAMASAMALLAFSWFACWRGSIPKASSRLASLRLARASTNEMSG